MEANSKEWNNSQISKKGIYHLKNKIINTLKYACLFLKFNAKNIRELFTASNINSLNGLFIFKLV